MSSAVPEQERERNPWMLAKFPWLRPIWKPCNWWPLLSLAFFSPLAILSCSLFQVPSQGFPPHLPGHGERRERLASRFAGPRAHLSHAWYRPSDQENIHSVTTGGEDVSPYISIHGVPGHYLLLFLDDTPFPFW
jgi:hypothetical protein